jgi:hypothetical protein
MSITGQAFSPCVRELFKSGVESSVQAGCGTRFAMQHLTRAHAQASWHAELR